MKNESNQNNVTLLSLMQKQSFQLVSAVNLFMKGELEINQEAITDVIRSIPEKQRVISNADFLLNLANNSDLFAKLVKINFVDKEDMTADENQNNAISKAIKSFKDLQRLKQSLTLADYANFIKADEQTVSNLIDDMLISEMTKNGSSNVNDSIKANNDNDALNNDALDNEESKLDNK